MPKAASIQELLQSGAHFGHLTRRWNPKMKEFIFMQRNGIHIIDLKKTQNYLQEAIDEIQKLSRAGKTILFVGTKKQSTEIIRNEAVRAGMPYVTHRWLGGMLTNFATVRKSISRMEEIERMKTDGTFDELTKKERLMLSREQEKLENTLGGIANMNYSISNTAEYGEYVTGPRIITAETKAEMKRVLEDIQSGRFTRDWMLENRVHQTSFKATRRRNAEHSIEQVGEQLRGMMPWIGANRLVDKAKN